MNKPVLKYISELKESLITLNQPPPRFPQPLLSSRLDDVPQRVVLLVDGEQTGVGHLGVLVDGDPTQHRGR